MRSGSDSRSFQGAWSERYLLASATTRIDSLTADFIRDRSRSAPTVANAASVVANSFRSAAVRSPADGISPMFFAVNDSERLTRLPQAATSSSLLRRTTAAQVKSVSEFSGPLADR